MSKAADKGISDFRVFRELIDNIYDEIFIWDSNRVLVYVNKAAYRHYGYMPEFFIGKSLDELIKLSLWSPSSVWMTFKEKKPVLQTQKTYMGVEMKTISVPYFDSDGNIKYVLQSVRDSDNHLLKEVVSNLEGAKHIEDADTNEPVIYRSKAMQDTMRSLRNAASLPIPVLLAGETGTGKSFLAKYIHRNSDRRAKPMVTVNMGAFNPNVIEAELFGYTKGSFTGANRDGKKGIIESADGGTLFLDEIGEFPYELQVKLLHVLQEGEVLPVGATKPVRPDVRIICATNRDLYALMKAGKFREDLYHRINMFEITVPPLRERKDDILLLASWFLNIFNDRYHKNVSFSDEVLELFREYSWRGNVRELSNVVERGVISAEDNSWIKAEHLPENFFRLEPVMSADSRTAGEVASLDSALESYERQIILGSVKKYKSSRKVAEKLGISQSKASRLIRKYAREEDMDGAADE